jgi:oxygen-independent coproporphyrinogen-3 oxidase
VSNWAASAGSACRHNLIYWRGGDWWGFGPGAHSHVGGVRWWNVKHPTAYRSRLADHTSPGYAREVLGPEERQTEEVMLRLRLAEGLPLAALGPAAEAEAHTAMTEGLLNAERFALGHAVLTLRGRLLADAVVLRLLTSRDPG